MLQNASFDFPPIHKIFFAHLSHARGAGALLSALSRGGGAVRPAAARSGRRALRRKGGGVNSQTPLDKVPRLICSYNTLPSDGSVSQWTTITSSSWWARGASAR